MAEWVDMEHPKIEGKARVLRSSFDKLYKKKGWKLVGAKKKTTKKVKSTDE